MHKSGEIKSLRNYLLKYLAKTFVETIPEWTPEELVFNAIAWKQGYRFFDCSWDLSDIKIKARSPDSLTTMKNMCGNFGYSCGYCVQMYIALQHVFGSCHV